MEAMVNISGKEFVVEEKSEAMLAQRIAEKITADVDLPFIAKANGKKNGQSVIKLIPITGGMLCQ